MKELLLVIAWAYVCWYLALNEKEATIRTLTNAKDKAKELAYQFQQELDKEIEENEKLNNLLDGGIEENIEGGDKYYDNSYGKI